MDKNTDFQLLLRPVAEPAQRKLLLTRRQLLGGAVSSPLSVVASDALGADLPPFETDPFWYNIRFELAADGRSVRITEVKIPVKKEKYNARETTEDNQADNTKPSFATEWRVDAEKFGPEAWFDMDMPRGDNNADNASDRRLLVRNVSFGLVDNATITFIFTRANNTFAGPGAWFVAFETDIWRRKATDGGLRSSPVNFKDFVNQVAPLPGLGVTGGIVHASLNRIFGGFFSVAGKPIVQVEFDKDATWTARVLKNGTFGAVDTQVRILKFSFQWERPDQTTAGGRSGADQLLIFAGRCKLQVLDTVEKPADDIEGTIAPVIRVGPRANRRIRLSLNGTKLPMTIPMAILLGTSPLKPDKRLTVLGLNIGSASVSCYDEDHLVAGELTGKNLIVTETSALISTPDVNGKSKATKKTQVTRRTVLWGDMTGASKSSPGYVMADERPPHEDVEGLGEIISPVGRLWVGPPATELLRERKIDEPPKTHGASIDAKAELERLLQIAVGDKSATPDSTVFVVSDDTVGLRRAFLDVSLIAATAAVPDVSYSRLSFIRNPPKNSYETPDTSAGQAKETGTSDKGKPSDNGKSAELKPLPGSDLAFVFSDGKPLGIPSGEYPRRAASCFVWIGPDRGTRLPRASFDLNNARLACARDIDLAALTFRFQGFVLDFAPYPQIRPAFGQGRVFYREDGTLEDSRPILVAEIGPQHVLEEAIFRPEPPSLPDVDVKTPLDGTDIIPTKAAILDKLGKLKTPHERADFRKKVRDHKKEIERKDIEKRKIENPLLVKTERPFASFLDFYSKAAEKAKPPLPVDQQIYIGPYALDPQAMALARSVQLNDQTEMLKSTAWQVLERVETLFRDMQMAEAARLNTSGAPSLPPSDLQSALRNEAVLEGLDPLYGLFRFFWTTLVNSQQSPKVATPTQFLIPGNRPEKGYDAVAVDKLLLTAVSDFADHIAGKDKLDDLMGAHLSGKSRLAFRVNSQPIHGLGEEEINLLTDEPTADASVRFAPIPLTFDALTDWSRHEPSVTRRARKRFEPLLSGVLPPLGNRPSNAGDVDALALQGITPGTGTSIERIAQIQASMTVKPTEMETSIELPARLILSTAEDAVWITRRRVPQKVLDALRLEREKRNLDSRPDKKPSGLTKSSVTLDTASTAPASAPLTIVVHPAQPSLPPMPKITSTQSAPLWSIRLELDERQSSASQSAGVRVVASPDFRPTALGVGLTSGPDHLLPGQGAPPRGPLAPWLIGPEMLENITLENDKDEKAEIDRLSDSSARSKPKYFIIRFLKRRSEEFSKLARDKIRLFRTSLDANDRHQLVLMSSAYGLPVIGKGSGETAQPPAGVGNSANIGGPSEDAGHFDPGQAYSLIDLPADQAVYRPIPLNLTDLSLTALGGSMFHDTIFKPAAGAIDFYGRKVFDGFSIERWRQDIVLGRDISTQVVYKGYLMPFGHRASLVKLTERLFVRVEGHGIKAILRQRLFLKVGNPDKAYPAIGQPHKARAWCGRNVKILTVQSPDLVDPNLTTNINPAEEGLTGRIGLGRVAGLAFWPKTDMTGAGLFQFEFEIDGAKTRAPLVFVDNIAATTPEAMAIVAGHYMDDALLPRRLFSMAAQKIKYAPATRTGETDYPTDQIVVGVSGLFSEEPGKWLGGLTNFVTSGVLEAAEQPPFYPYMVSANIRLSQSERMTGGRPLRPTVRFDGHYVRNGLHGDPDATNSERNLNPFNIFLLLDACLPIDMGSNGDRSGGIGRPNMTAVALSRSKGPVGSGGARSLKFAPESFAAQQVNIGVNGDGIGNSLRPTPQGGEAQRLEHETLFSMAHVFDAEAQKESAVPAGTGTRTVAPGTPPAAATSESVTGQTKDVSSIITSFFSSDAKLLGAITLSELFSLLDIVPEDMPVLKEITQYGTAAANSAELMLNDVRQRVLQPLLEGVTRLEGAWKDFGRTLKEKTGAVTQNQLPINLDEIYPEISRDIQNLKTVLGEAVSTTDALALPAKLAEVYEAAQRLIRTLEMLASNPADRIGEAIEATFTGRLQGVLGMIANLGEAAKRLVTLLKNALIDDVQKAILEQIPDDDTLDELITAHLPIGIGRFDGVQSLADLDVDALKLQAVIKELENLAIACRPKLKTLAKSILDSLSNNTDIISAIRSTVEQTYYKDVTAAVDKAKQNIASLSLDDDARYVLGRELAPYFDLKVQYEDSLEKFAETPEIRTLIATARRIEDVYTRIKDLKDVDTKNPKSALMSFAGIIRDLSGYDLTLSGEAIAEDIFAKIGTKPSALFGALVQRLLQEFGPIFDEADLKLRLRSEIAWCDALAKAPLGTKPQPLPTQSSYEVLRQITAGQILLPEMIDLLGQIKYDIGNIKGIPSDALNNAQDVIEDLKSQLTTKNESQNNADKPIGMPLRRIYCDFVDLIVELRILKRNLDNSKGSGRLDRWALEEFAMSMRVIRRAIERIGEDFWELLLGISDLVAKNSELFATIGLAAVLDKVILDTNVTASAKIELKKLQGSVKLNEEEFCSYLANIIDRGLSIIHGGVLTSTTTLNELANWLENVQEKIGIDLKNTLNSVRNLRKLAGSLEGLKLPTQPPKTFRELLAIQINNQPIRDFFGQTAEKGYRQLAEDLRSLEAAIIADLAKVWQQLTGLPETIKSLAIKAAVNSTSGSSLIELGGLAYDNMLKVRQEAHDTTVKIPFLKPLAEKTFYVERDPAYPQLGASGPLTDYDRLHQERDIIKLLKTDDKPSLKQPTQLVQSYSNGRAAPLQILDRIGELASNAWNGDLIEAIDLSVFRDQIEDAISGLLPVRSRLSYDFSSTVKEPSSNPIFRPRSGSPFGMEVRGDIDYLKKSADFSARGYFGPFDVHLIGDSPQALTLKFGGASFEIRNGSQPKFDVIYEDFEIGKDLAFAAQLQDFLNPSGGVFIQPLIGRPGLEVGYGLDLGVISVGAASFFNVTLNVSAELPFDNSEARFKVGLGRRLDPFTISILPFAGSGYFSVTSSANGVEEFEASFEFGGGGSLGFGPLTVQARIQTGVFVRLVTVGKDKSTTLFGTFFAGGSAKIWIFSFSASLYVRLSSADNGSMYGEAVFSFSFSMGFCKYRYSINVFKKEPPVGTSNTKKTDNGQLNQKSNPVRYAALVADPSVMSDADPIGWGEVGSMDLASVPPEAQLQTTAGDRETTGNLPGTLTAAESQVKNWRAYAQYFDTNLLDMDGV